MCAIDDIEKASLSLTNFKCVCSVCNRRYKNEHLRSTAIK